MASKLRPGDPQRAKIEKITRRLGRLRRLDTVLGYAPKTLLFGLFIAWSAASRANDGEATISIGDWLLYNFGLSVPVVREWASGNTWIGPAVLGGVALYFMAILWVFLRERHCFGALSDSTRDLLSQPDVRWTPKIALHLRSFEDDRPLAANSRKTFLQWLLSMKVPFAPRADGVLRRMIRSALPDAILLRIGDKRLFPLAGAPIRVSDDGWWPLFQELSRHAVAIVMSPLTRHHGGTYRELEQILAGPLRFKTVFLVPATSGRSRGLIRRIVSSGLSALIFILTLGLVRLRAETGRVRWEATRNLLPAKLREQLRSYPGGAGFLLPTSSGHVYAPGLSGRAWDHPIALRSICLGRWFGRPVWREAGSATLHLSAALGLAILLFGAGVQHADSRLLPLLRSAASAADIGGQAFVAVLILTLGYLASNYYFQFCRRQGLFAAGKWLLGVAPLLVWGTARGMDVFKFVPPGLIGQYWQAIDQQHRWMVFLAAVYVLNFLVITMSRPDKGKSAT